MVSMFSLSGQMRSDALLWETNGIGRAASLSLGFGWTADGGTEVSREDGENEGEVAAAFARVLRTLDGFVP